MNRYKSDGLKSHLREIDRMENELITEILSFFDFPENTEDGLIYVGDGSFPGIGEYASFKYMGRDGSLVPYWGQPGIKAEHLKEIGIVNILRVLLYLETGEWYNGEQ